MQAVRSLADRGFNKSEIARTTGIPRSTVKDWLLSGIPGGSYSRALEPVLTDLPAAAYSYLLGMYLGDGHLVDTGRTWLLRVYCDAKYREILDELEDALLAVAPGRSVRCVPRLGRCVAVSAYWKHWPVVFPQHGLGMKHTRRIDLEPWQRNLTGRQAGAFVRGLIHSDGCRYIARQPKPGSNGHYEYVRYGFSNRSVDIKRLLCEHLALLGVEWTEANSMNIQIARKPSVQILEEIVGPKR